jgi:hypothetical protein
MPIVRRRCSVRGQSQSSLSTQRRSGFSPAVHAEEIGVEAVDAGACGQAEEELAEMGIAGLIAGEGERDGAMAEALKRPEAMERSVVRRERARVEDLYAATILMVDDRGPDRHRGEGFPLPPLPHHRTSGSASGGSRS